MTGSTAAMPRKGGFALIALALVLELAMATTAPAAQDNPVAQQEFELFREAWGDWKPSNLPALEDRRLPVPLSLQDAVARSLEHNLDIKIERHGPAIRMADVVRAEAAFDAVVFGETSANWRDRANLDTGFFTRTIETPGGTREIRIPRDPFVQTEDYNYSLGLRKRLPTGASIELAQSLRRFRSNESGLFYDPFYEWILGLELRQPLLRDFGLDVNRANIAVARNNYAISLQQFNLQVIDTVASVEQLYWQLVFARQQVRILQQLVDQAQMTLDRLQERTRLDAPAAMIARNRGLIQRAQAELTSARNTVVQVQDQLLERLNDPNLQVGEPWEILPTEIPAIAFYPIDRDDALARGLRYRSELVAQNLTLDNAAIGVGVAENQLLPRLDLIARQETTGAGLSPGTAFDTQREYDTINYMAGLSFEVPLGNRAAEAQLVRAEHEYHQERLRLASFREQILADISISLTDLENTAEEIVERRLSATAEGNTLQAYVAEEDAMVRITPDFLNRKLDQEERLANAQIQLARTIFRHNLAILQAQQAQGTLLHYNHIRLKELENAGRLPDKDCCTDLPTRPRGLISE